MAFNLLERKIISSETTTIGRFEIVYDVFEKNGKQYPYSYVKMKKGVGILGFVDDKIILVKQYRYIWNRWLWEIPGGMVDDNENPQQAAIREFEEETGFKISEIDFLGLCYPSVGSTTELQYLYVAKCKRRLKQKLDDLEKIKVHLISKEDFENMIVNGEFNHGMGLSIWVRYFLKSQKSM